MDQEVGQLDDVLLAHYVHLPQLMKNSAFLCLAKSHTQSPAARNLNRGDVAHRTIFVSCQSKWKSHSSPGLTLILLVLHWVQPFLDLV
jgi:hypothetical protein